MAFEEVNTTGFKTYLTKYGVSKLLQPNTNFDIKYFSLNDNGVNYGESVDSSVLVTAVNGEDIKTLYNGSDDITIIGTEQPTQDQIARRDIVFVDDCNDNEYKNLDVTFNLGNYLQDLRETNSSLDTVLRGYEPFIRLYDFVNVYEYTENAFGEYKLWDTKNYNLNYTFSTDQDYKNYTIFNNTLVNKNGGASSVVYDNNRFKSPFQLTTSSFKSNSTGRVTQNGQFVLQLYPVGSFVYRTDTTEYRPEELTDAILGSERNVIPTVKFNGINHNLKLETNTVYRDNVNLPIFRFTNLLESGITAAKNMFEFYGNDSATDSNTKVITINMDVSPSDSKITNVKTAKLRLNITLDLNESNWNSSNPFYTIN
jgi:hypothetical protein